MPIEGGVQVEPEGASQLVRGYAESGGVVVQGGVYAERGAFGQTERSATAIGGASDKIPEAGVGYTDGQGIIFSFADD